MEPQEVKAHVIEDGVELVTGEAELMAYLQAKADAAYGIHCDMDDAAFKKMTLAETRRACAALNGDIKDIEARYAEVMGPYKKAIKDCDEKKKAVLADLKKVKELYDNAKKVKELEILDRRHAQFAEEYEGYAGVLADLVPYDRIREVAASKGFKWDSFAQTFTPDKCIDELHGIVDRIAADYELLQAGKEERPCYETAQMVFFDTFDLGQAFAAEKGAEKRLAEIKELDEVVSANKAPEVTVIEHEPIKAKPEPKPEPKQRTEYQLVIMLDDAELDALRGFIKSNRVGEVVRFGRRS